MAISDEVLVGLASGVGILNGITAGVATAVYECRLRARWPNRVGAAGATVVILLTALCVALPSIDPRPESMNSLALILWGVLLAILAGIGTVQTLGGGPRWWTNAAGLVLQIAAAALLIWVAGSINNVFYDRALASNPGGGGYTYRTTRLVHAFGSSAGSSLALTLFLAALVFPLWRGRLQMRDEARQRAIVDGRSVAQ